MTSSWEVGNVVMCKCELEEDEVMALGDSRCIARPASCFPRRLFRTFVYTARSVSLQENARKKKHRCKDRDSSEKVLLTPDRLGERKAIEPTKKKKIGGTKEGPFWISRKMYGS